MIIIFFNIIQYILLLKKLTEIYKKEFDEYLNNILDEIKKNKNHIDKRMIPDIGNFMVLLLFSNFEISEDLWKCLIDESSIRQMYWMFHGEDTVQDVKKIISETSEISYSRLFKTRDEAIKEIAKLISKGELKIEKEKINTFKTLLNYNNIFDEIELMILGDENIYEFKEFKKKKDKPKNASTSNPFDELFSSEKDKDEENEEEEKEEKKKSENEIIFEKKFDEKINDYLQILEEDTLYKIFELINDKIYFSNFNKFFDEQKLKDIEKSEYDRGYADLILKDIHDENIKKNY